MTFLLLVVLAVVFAWISWGTIRSLARHYEALPIGLVVLVALFGIYAWKRTQEISELRGLVRGLEQRQAEPPDEQQLAGFPASFGPVDAGPLFTLKVREDPFADMTPEQEEVLLKQHLRADTERMFQQARTLRSVAYIVSVVFIILLVVFGRYLWRYRSRRGPSPSDATPRRRF